MIGAETAKVNVIAPHRGEEPCIQGYHGSGAVFFSGCNMRCVFCQNYVWFSLSFLFLSFFGGLGECMWVFTNEDGVKKIGDIAYVSRS